MEKPVPQKLLSYSIQIICLKLLNQYINKFSRLAENIKIKCKYSYFNTCVVYLQNNIVFGLKIKLEASNCGCKHLLSTYVFVSFHKKTTPFPILIRVTWHRIVIPKIFEGSRKLAAYF